MNDMDFEQLMEDMADFTAEQISNEQENVQRQSFESTLRKVSNMLSSKSFDRKCKDQAKKYGVNKQFIKNEYAANMLEKLGVGATAILEIIGEAFNYLIRFISYVIQKIMDFAISALCKLVNILTFRKEVTA